MDEPRYHQTEWSKSEKDKYMISLIREILKKWCKWTYLWKRNRLTDRENKLTVIKDEREDKDKWGVWD